MDPKEFSAPDGGALGNALHNMNLPDDTWEWAWSKWFVNMANDVDDQGWIYSWRFRSKDWKGYPRIGRSFVRQRQWKRLRRRKREFCDAAGDAGRGEETCEEVIKILGRCTSEKEKVAAVSQYLQENPERAEDIRENGKRLFGTMMMPVSEHELMRKFSQVPSFIRDSANRVRLEQLKNSDASSM